MYKNKQNNFVLHSSLVHLLTQSREYKIKLLFYELCLITVNVLNSFGIKKLKKKSIFSRVLTCECLVVQSTNGGPVGVTEAAGGSIPS